MKTLLLGMLGHDLRSPLNAIAVAAELLNGADAPPVGACSAK